MDYERLSLAHTSRESVLVFLFVCFADFSTELWARYLPFSDLNVPTRKSKEKAESH